MRPCLAVHHDDVACDPSDPEACENCRQRAENRIAQRALENYRESVVRDTKARCTREIVEALRERSARSRAGADAGAGCWYEGAAAFIERTFLNGEGTT